MNKRQVQADEIRNVPAEHRKPRVLMNQMTTTRNFFVASLAAVLVAACATSPTGQSQLMLVSGSQLAKMGNASYAKMKQELPIAQDPEVTRYVRCVAHAITAQAATITSDVPADWDVTVFKKDAVNAFALPGGNIGVFTGLLEVAQGPAQLAAVLGHEVSHVLADHANARVSRQLATQTVLQLASAILGGGAGGQMAMAALGLGAQVGILLPYTRGQESEADVLGLRLMARAGFDPRAAVALWRNMAKASSGNAPPQFLSTHPSNQNRIQELQSRIPNVMPTYKQARAHGLTPNCG